MQHISVLDESDCRAHLADAAIGRAAVVVGNVAHVFPVNFVLDNDEIVFRSGPGTKLDAAVAGSTISFEVDAFDPIDHSGWSVLVIGVARLVVDPDDRVRLSRIPLRPWAADDGEWIRLRPVTYSGRRVGPTV